VRRLRTLFAEFADRGYASATACLAHDLEALTARLLYPLEHRGVWRSTNLLKRSVGEVKRWMNVIDRFPGETSCLSLYWAVLDLVSPAPAASELMTSTASSSSGSLPSTIEAPRKRTSSPRDRPEQ
jgi:transposase-like protein